VTSEDVVVTKFNESVPTLLQRDMLRSVLACYQQADKHVKRHYPPPEAITLRGWIRRADIEVDIRNVAAKYVGAEGQPEPNTTGSIFHSVVIVGAVKLTQSKLANPRQMVRPSGFREEYAQESAQLLLGFVARRPRKVVPIGEREYFFAVLIHGCSKKDKSRPYFVQFAFPNKDCTDWIGRIDLMKKFPDVVSEFYAPIVAAESEQRRVRLKRGIKRGGKKQA
jgi:hypothetical protein